MEGNVFESKSIPRVFFSMTLPVVFGMLVTIVYNITDTYFIARTLNTDLVAGVSLCAPVFTMLMAFGNIFGQGGISLISRLLGMNDQERLYKVSSFCFYIAIIFGAVSGVLLLLFKTPALYLLGADESTFAYAGQYYTWISIGAPLVVLSFIHSNLLRAEGMAKESMIGSIGGSVTNIIFDPILIFVLGMGAAGAAIATLFGYVFTIVYDLYIVKKKSRALSTDIRLMKISVDEIKQIFGVGLAAALTNIMQSFALVLTNQKLLHYGSNRIAAMGIVQKVSMVVMLVIIAFAFGGAPLIGYFYGSKNQKKLKELMRFSLTFLCGLSICMSLVMILLAPVAVSAFLKEEELIAIAVFMLRVQVSSMVCLAVVQYISIVFQATGKSLPALILAISRQGVVFAVVIAIAAKLCGFGGVIAAQPIADLVTTVIAVGMYMKVKEE